MRQLVKPSMMHNLLPQHQKCASLRQLSRRRRTACGPAHRSFARFGEPSPADGDDGSPLFIDPYAELLAGWRRGETRAGLNQEATDEAEVARDVIATAHLDRLLLNASAIAAVNRITQGDYRQVVLLGDALDTRPYRLPLPSGVAIFMVAPAAAHAVAEAALASDAAAAIAAALAAAAEVPTAEAEAGSSAGAGDAAAAAAGRGLGGKARVRPRGPRAPPGCLVRRVAVDLQSGDLSSLPSALAAAGFRADRLSVWAVQGLAGLGLGQRDVLSLLAEAANCAAYHSLLVGELPPLGASEAANSLAECGLLGAPLAFGAPDASYGRWRPEWGPPIDPETPQRWLFASQQIRLSAAQMDTYETHRAAAEGMDEDFFDNFS